MGWWHKESLIRRNTSHGLATMLVAGTMIVLLAHAVAGQSPAQATRTDAQGGITVKAVFVTSTYLRANPTDPLAGKVDPERNIVFAITLDTHSGDLAGHAMDDQAKVLELIVRGLGAAPERTLRWTLPVE